MVNADGLFRGGAGDKEPGISQADLMRKLGHGSDCPKNFLLAPQYRSKEDDMNEN